MPPILLPLAQSDSAGSRHIVDQLARTPLSQVVVFVAVLSVFRLALTPYLMKTPIHKRTALYGFARFGNEAFDAFIYAGVFVFMLIRPFAVQTFLIPSGSMWPELYVNDFIVANKAIYRYTDPQEGDVVVFHPPKEGALSPADLDASGDMKFDFVKRCIGVPGDLIELRKGVLYRNGKKVDEPYVAYSNCIDQLSPCQEYRAMSDDDKKLLTLPSFKIVKYKGELIPLNYTDSDANAAGSSSYSVAPKFQIVDPDEQKKAMALPAQKLPPGNYLMLGDNRNNSYDGRAWGLITRDRIIGRSEFVWWPLPQVHMTR